MLAFLLTLFRGAGSFLCCSHGAGCEHANSRTDISRYRHLKRCTPPACGRRGPVYAAEAHSDGRIRAGGCLSAQREFPPDPDRREHRRAVAQRPADPGISPQAGGAHRGRKKQARASETSANTKNQASGLIFAAFATTAHFCCSALMNAENFSIEPPPSSAPN